MTPITIIIPVLNEEKSLPLLLQDLSQQTYADFQVIIVDGKSEDQTIKQAKKFKSKFKKFSILTSSKRNVSHQRNMGAKHAQSDWLLFMDADNRLPPYFMQGAKYKIDYHQPTILSFYCQSDSTNQKDQLIIKLANLYIDLQKNTSNPYCFESCIAIKKQFFLSQKGFNENVPWGEGNDFLRKAAKKKVYMTYTQDPTYTYSLRRLRKEGTLKVTRNLAEMEFSRISGIKINLDKAKKLYPMTGGNYFTQDRTSRSTIERMFAELSKVKSLPQQTKKLIMSKAYLPSSLRSIINLIDPPPKEG